MGLNILLIRGIMKSTIVLLVIYLLQVTYADTISYDSTDTSEYEIILDDESEEELPPIDSMPIQTKFIEADYPIEFQKKGIEGTVLLSLLVNEKGSVDSVFVEKSLNHTLDSLARKAAKEFLFTPAKVGNDSVPVYIEYAYNFSLDKVLDKIERYTNLSGKIIERGTNKKLSNITVYALFDDSLYNIDIPLDKYLQKIGSYNGQSYENGVIATTTDSLGNFQFQSLPVGIVTIKIAETGYEAYQSRDTIRANEELMNKIFLRKLSYDDYSVTSYYRGEEKEVSRRKLSINEIRQVAGLNGDAIKVVQALPGVARPSFGGGSVVIRGSYTWDSNFYLDGILIPLLYHFGGLKSTYNSDAMAGLDFYPGGFGTDFGNVIGGVVNIKSKEPTNERIKGKVDISTLDASAFIEGPIKKDKVSFLATARRSYFGELLNWGVKKFDIHMGATTTPFYWDYTARVHITPNKKNSISVVAFGSYDSLAVLFENTALGSQELGSQTDMLKQKIAFNIAGVTWKSKIRDNLTNTFSPYYTNVNTNMAAFGFFRQRFRSNFFTYREKLNWQLNEKITLNFGSDGYVGNVDLFLDVLTNKGISRDSATGWTFSNIGAFINAEFKPNDRLLIIPGIRYDYYGSLIYNGSILPEYWNYGNWNNKGFSGDPSLRVTTRFKINKKNTIKAAIGNYNQEPQPQGQVIHPLWGTPSLPSSKATQIVMGDEWHITDLLFLDVQAYFNYQWDLPRRRDSLDIANAHGSATPNYYDDGRGRTYGLEFMLRHNQSEHFFGWIAYTLSRSERWDHIENRYALFGKDETNNIQIVAGWKLPHNWEIGGRTRYVTGNPTTEIIGRKQNINNHSFSPIYGPKNGIRMDPFFQFDIRVEKKFILKRSIISTYLDVQNALYALYKSPEMNTYDDFYMDKQTVSMPPIPALGFSWEF